MDSSSATLLRITVVEKTPGSEIITPLVDGTTVSTTSDNTTGTNVIEYNGEQPLETYVGILRGIQYVNTAEEPASATVSLLVQVFTVTSGGQTGSNIARTTIGLIPVNDNNPVFSEAEYLAQVSEAASRGEAVVTVQASDRDELSNTRITYEIEGGSEEFSINATSGVISTAQELDAESTSSYEFIVIASDNDGGSPRSSSVSVEVLVVDVNDHGPIFSLPQYSALIRENTIGGQTVINVTATDDDVTSANNDITYELLINEIGSGSAFLTPLPPQQATPLPFTIDPRSGEVRVAESAKIDFEAVAEYSLEVVARDNGQPQLSASVEVVVSVLNENDEAPVFTQTLYTGSLSDDAAEDTSILTVLATDADSVSVTYSIDGSEYLDVDPLTGVVVLKRTVDFITTPSLSATVIANDMGSPPRIGEAGITIEILNVNNNPPIFSQTSYTFRVREGEALDAAVNATDADGDPLTYLIVEGSVAVLTLDPITGALTTQPGTTLDSETQSVYLLTIAATDDLFTSHADVTVEVEDANDNAPVFSSPQFSVTVPESVAPGSPVFQISAEDADSGSNALIVYSLPEEGEVFAIEPLTGVITIEEPIDFETNSGPFVIRVVASNTEPPFFNASATVVISVSDSNDNQPILSLSPVSFDYLENYPPLHIASNITITDADSSSHLLTSCDVTLERGECQLDTSDLRDSCGDCALTCGEEIAVNDELNILESTVQVYSTGQVVSFMGNLSEADYQSVLSTLSYENLAPEPLPGRRSVLIQCHDAHHSSNTLELTINLIPVNDNPIVIVADTQRLRFQEGDPALTIGGSVVLTDGDASAEVVWLRAALLGSIDPERESITLTSGGEGVESGLEVILNQRGSLNSYQVTYHTLHYHSL